MTYLVRPFTLFAALSCIAALFAGCASQANRRHIPAEVTTDAPIVGRPTLGLPIFLPDSDVSVVPFTIDRPKRWLEDADKFEADTTRTRKAQSVLAAYESPYNSSIGLSQSVRWHNAVIQPKSGPGQLVLKQKGIISQFDVVGHWIENERENQDEEKTFTFVPKAVLFLATLKDSNGDKQLNRIDSNVLLAADTEGGGLHAITQPNTQVQTTRYNTERNLIVIMVKSDTNGDGLFTEADSTAPYIYTPGSPDIAKPLVAPGKAQEAERLLK